MNGARVGLVAILATVALIGVAVAATPVPLAAQERILSYDSEVDIRADGSMDVVERIRVVAEGELVRRGIYREFPTRYTDRFGNRVRVDFRVLGVERNGETEDWFTERMQNGVRLNTGGDDFLPVPQVHEFTLRFRTTHQLGFFDLHDELYWNAIGTGWAFPIESGTVTVRLPEPVPTTSMTAEAYTGAQGATGGEYAAEIVAPGVATWRLTEPLGPREAFTIVLTFPKGVVREPTTVDRAARLLSDNRGVLVALVALALLVAFCLREWRRVGRDPRAGVIIPQYEPLAELSPGAHRHLTRMGYDTRCFSSDVLRLAVAGEIRIEKEKKLLGSEWALVRDRGAKTRPPNPIDLGVGPTALLAAILPRGHSRVVLESKNASTISTSIGIHKTTLERQLHGRYFQRNARSVVIAALIAVAGSVGALAISGGFGVAALMAVSGAMLLVVLSFAVLVKAPTPEGRAALDRIAGLALYLRVAEKDELAMLRGPGAPPRLDAERYEALLPYAVALEVEDAWTEKFTAAVGVAAAAQAASNMAWYGGSGPITDLGSFTKSIGSSLSSTISSSSSPPGSSSGSGGGGSAGGGGGGGGGGGR